MRNVPQTHNDYYGTAFIWFIGEVVEKGDRGRVRVRAFGVHSIRMPASDCPWARVMYPTTGAQLGSGHFTHNLEEGSWVFGFFSDGEDYQQPVVVGSFSGGRGSGTRVDPYDPRSTIPNTTEGLPEYDGAYIEGNSNQEKAYNFFMEKLIKLGLHSKAHMLASGMIGSLTLESNMNPAAMNPSSGAYGIAQWLDPSRIVFPTNINANDRARVLSENDRKLPPDAGGGPFPTTLAGQLSYLWWELENKEHNARKSWFRADSLFEATVAAAKFERAEDMVRSTMEVNTAHSIFKKRYLFAKAASTTLQYTPSEKMALVRGPQ